MGAKVLETNLCQMRHTKKRLERARYNEGWQQGEMEERDKQDHREDRELNHKTILKLPDAFQ